MIALPVRLRFSSQHFAAAHPEVPGVPILLHIDPNHTAQFGIQICLHRPPSKIGCSGMN